MTDRFNFIAGAITKAAGLGDRQIRVVASDPAPDRCRDILVPEGCDLTNYKKNPIVLADHDGRCPIGNAVPLVVNGRLEAVINFAPKGASVKADEYCALAKAGVLSGLSVGFRIIEAEPRDGGGLLIKRWELLELSLVAVPMHADAVVIERSFNSKAGRVLSAKNASALSQAHDAAEQCRSLVAGVLAGADDGSDHEDDAKAAARRQRDVEILRLKETPLSPSEARRRRDVEMLQLGGNVV